ncbi:hypothetical protein MAR_030047, partial [Mya arenaria]
MIAPQRRSLRERRTYIGTNPDVGVAKIVEKYPFLGNKKFIEFFLMQPSHSNASISDNWASVLDKLCKLLGFSKDQASELETSYLKGHLQ